MASLADAFFQGVNARQRKDDRDYRNKMYERSEREYQDQQKAKAALGRAIQGDQTALSDLATADPGTYMQYQQFRAGQTKSDFDQKRAAAQYAVDTLGTIEMLPPDQRPGAYAKARSEAARLGYDISHVPEQYDPTTTRALALRNKSALEWYTKQQENAITTSPGMPASPFGGSLATPGFNPAAPSHSAGQGGSPPLKVPTDAGSYFGGAIEHNAKRYNIPPGLLPALIAQESAFNPNAVSSAGAIGPAQLMPATAKGLGVDPNNPTQNIEGGARYLSQMLQKYGGNVQLALMAYNWGPGNVDNWIKSGSNPNAIPAETRGHFTRIMGALGGGQPTQQAAPQQVAQAPQGQPTSDAGVTPLFRGGKPFNDGLSAGYQWGQDAQGNRVQMRIPGGKQTLKQVTIGNEIWNVDEQGNKVNVLGPRPERNEGEGRSFKEEEKLRNEFKKQSANFTDLAQHFTRLQAASQQTDGAGDIAMVYSFMKMLDPTSVVREGEFATAANAGGIPDRVRAMYNRAINGERLPPEVRASFVEQGARQFDKAYDQYEHTKNIYTGLATSYELDPSRVVVDLTGGVGRPQIKPGGGGGDAPPPPGGQQAPGAAQAAVPRAVNHQTGETLVLRNGQWVPEK